MKRAPTAARRCRGEHEPRRRRCRAKVRALRTTIRRMGPDDPHGRLPCGRACSSLVLALRSVPPRLCPCYPPANLSLSHAAAECRTLGEAFDPRRRLGAAVPAVLCLLVVGGARQSLVRPPGPPAPAHKEHPCD